MITPFGHHPSGAGGVHRFFVVEGGLRLAVSAWLTGTRDGHPTYEWQRDDVEASAPPASEANSRALDLMNQVVDAVMAQAAEVVFYGASPGD